MILHYPVESVDFPSYNSLRSTMSRCAVKNNINLLNTYLRRHYINANNIMLWNINQLNDHRTNNDMEGYHYRLRERFTNRVTNFWGFMLFMLKETCLMNAILMRMRGGEVMKGRRKKYRRNEDRIEQFKANYMEDHNIILFLSSVRLCINN
jgi:hypothetical protein